MRLWMSVAAACCASAAGAAEPLPLVSADAVMLESAPVIWRRAEDIEAEASLSLLLEGVTPPLGFQLELYALAPGAARLAVGPRGTVVFVGLRGAGLTALIDADRDERAEEAVEVGTGFQIETPLAPCFASDGALYAVGATGVILIPAAEFVLRDPNIIAYRMNEQGDFAAQGFEPGASAVDCAVSHDGDVNIAVDAPESGGLISMTARGGDLRARAQGALHPRALALRPEDGAIWLSASDDVGGAIYAAPRDAALSQFGPLSAAEAALSAPPVGVAAFGAPPAPSAPALSAEAGALPLGMAFYDGDQLPHKYRGALLYAEQGVDGQKRLMALSDVNAPAPEIMLEGWVDAAGAPSGGPEDVAILRDGSILLADPELGAVYRLSWGAPVIEGVETDGAAGEPGALTLDPDQPLPPFE